ncbi:MAG: hypothetical protein M1826_005521 [Phylliscum demangeonii]|nr:MAG: hypothetical protein M1826_005521 [Phylliscum demangeonii]
MVKRSREDCDTSSTTGPISASGLFSSPPPPAGPDDETPSKFALLDESTSSGQHHSLAKERMICSLPPHRQALPFSSYEAYDVHYAKVHVNRCSACGRNFPTGHFLGLHIAEHHDPLNEARRARGERTYGCFVEDCARKCSTPQKRRRHMIDKHMFPKASLPPLHLAAPMGSEADSAAQDYDIGIVNEGIDKRSSMLRGQGHRRRSSAAFQSTQREQRLRKNSCANDFVVDGDEASAGESSPATTRPAIGPSAPKMASEHNEEDDEASSSADSSAATSSEDVTEGKEKNKPPDDLASITKSLSALQFVPPVLRLKQQGNLKGRK